MIPKMKLCLQTQEIPDIWYELEGTWTEQDTYGVSAQILLGADQARFFPHEAWDKRGALLQTDQAWLMQSKITSSYIIFRSCGKHSKKVDRNKSWIEANQIQMSSSVPEGEEVLISIMDTMTIEDVDYMEVQQDSDWLGVDVSALVCSTFVSPQATIHNKQQPQTQDNNHSDFSPFAPDYKVVNAQQVISSLPRVKDCKFNDAYILSHLEQLEIDPLMLQMFYC